MDWRKKIIYMHNQNYKVTNTFRILNMPKSIVWNIIKNFFDAGITFDLPRSGRPRTATTPKRIKAVGEKIRRNPKGSVRKMAADFTISKNSMRRIIQDHLKMKSLGIQKRHFMNDTHKRKQLKRSRNLISHMESGVSGEIVWSDEKLFTNEQTLNRDICNDVPRRLRALIDNSGRHIE